MLQIVPVMEVATGEHGDWVHKLVMAVNKGNCGRGQSSGTSTAVPATSINAVFNNQAGGKANNAKKTDSLEVVIGE